jgi:hypothetical protein
LAQFVIRETVKGDYLVVFWCGTGLQILALILCLSLKEEKFIYEKKSRKCVSIISESAHDDNKKQINSTSNF